MNKFGGQAADAGRVREVTNRRKPSCEIATGGTPGLFHKLVYGVAQVVYGALVAGGDGIYHAVA